MPVKIQCPNPKCDASYGVDEAVVGREVRCKKCGSTFLAGDDTPWTRSDDGVPPILPLDIANSFGRYRILRKLGQGGMGAVYLAHDDDLDRPFALKVPSLSDGDDRELLERFKREAKATAGFHHPNFCPVYEAGKVGERPYLAMAYIEGQTLTSKVSRHRPMDPREAARLVRTLALAMAEAHDRGILHRDLKPSNVMIDQRGAPVVMDFGLARRIASAADAELTASNAMLGTLFYMSPEQVRGDKSAMGPPTDLYGLSVILYELVTGRRPFEGPPPTVIAGILTVEAPSATDHRADLDPALEAIIARGLSKRIEDRHASMRDLAEVLEDYLAANGVPGMMPLVDASAPTLRDPSIARPPTNRFKPALAALGGFLALTLGVVVYVATDSGTVKVEGFDPKMVVRVDGQVARIEGVGEPIVVRSGKHGLLVTRGDAVVKAPESFEVVRGKETVVRVEFTPKVEVTKVNSPQAPTREAEKPAEPPSAPAQPPPAAPTRPFIGTVAGDRRELKLEAIAIPLRWCPPGEFKMGSPASEGGRSDDEAQVDVRLTDGFWMMETEVPQDLYKLVTGADPSGFKGSRNPVKNVSHDEAVKFAAQLTDKLRAAGQLPEGWEGRLPTEAQWEYAARAGTTTPFPFGDRLDSMRANFDGNYPYGGADKGRYVKKTAPIGSYKANAWGLFDTVGNVWEWTADGYQEQLPGAADPFVAPSGASARLLRGGCWSSAGVYARSAYRLRSAPGFRDPDVGFRLAAVQSGG